MVITQVPAKTSHWGLTTWPYGVPGRLGYKVDKIVIHWIDGDLATADLVFEGKTTPERMVSSHFAVEDSNVHQYVSINNTAWQAGKWLVNLSSVGIEHSAQPGRDASDATYETSSELIVSICKQLGLTPSRSLLHKHSEFTPDTCPGTIDLDRLAARAVELWNTPVGDIQVIHNNPGTLADAVITPEVTAQPFLINLSPNQTFNAEVNRMQRWLVSKGYLAGINANEYGYYGKKTQAAIDAFQKAHGIPRASEYGWWYDKTRAAANANL